MDNELTYILVGFFCVCHGALLMHHLQSTTKRHKKPQSQRITPGDFLVTLRDDLLRHARHDNFQIEVHLFIDQNCQLHDSACHRVIVKPVLHRKPEASIPEERS